MKKNIFLFLALASVISSQAQNSNDAILYAQDNITGTARFRAMGGAFGALGGDFSSITVNPAGSVVFTTNQVGFTLSNYNLRNNTSYYGTYTKDKDATLDLNQLGGVYVFENEDTSSGWKKFAVALNYDNIKSFDNSIFVAGTNPSNSIDNYFLSYANGLNLSIVNGTDYFYGDLFYNEQQAYLGYGAFIINEAADYDDNTNRSYVSLVPQGGNYYHENSIVSTGYNGKLSANFSTIYKDRLLLGVNFNAHFSDYRKSTSFYESNTNNTSTDDLVRRLRFNNDLRTFGNGYSFQIGAIYKATREFRLGLAIDSPTWYEFNDELTQRISAVSGSINGELPADQVNVVDPITMIYEPYRLLSPGKITTSIAYVFGKKGLFSFDYSVKDYGSTKFTPKRDYVNENNEISNSFVVASEFRFGAEYKIRQFSLRGGYRFEESPYKNGKTIGDLMGYSSGIGYNFGNFKIDAAYSFTQRDTQQAFFTQGFTEAPKITTKTNNITVSVIFEIQ
jgi:hypothetical protein